MGDGMQILIDLIIQKAKARKDLRSEIKELQKEAQIQTDIKINVSDVKRAQREIERGIKSPQLKIKADIDSGAYDAKHSDLIAKANQWTDANGRTRVSLENLNNTYQAFANSDNDEDKIANAKKLDAAIKETTNSIRKMNAEQAKDSKISSLNQKTQEFYDKNTKAHKKYGAQLKSILSQTASGASLTKDQLQSLEVEFVKITNAARQGGQLGLSFFDKIKQGAQSFSMWIGTTSILMKALSVGKDLVKNVKDIDSAMTSLYKVTDETSARYDKFLNTASEKAKQLGRSVSSLIEQSAEWAKLGYSIDEAEELSKVSSIYANVGEVDDATAVKDIVSALKAFNIEGKDAITVVDKLNQLGNKYATSSADLGEGLRNSASALAVAGNDINKSLAMLTGGTEITQDASEMGNAIKVLSMRLRGMKGKLEQLGEESGGIESISKIQTQILNLTKGKVNIFDNVGNFRDTYDIINDIAKVWKEISQTDQAALLEIVAGKQRGNQIAALIQSFQSGQAQKAYADAVNAEGSAMQEQERWLESIEAKTQQFEASWQSLSTTFLDSDIVKGFVDFGTGAVNILESIIDKVGALNAVIGGAGLFAGIKGIGSVKSSLSEITATIPQVKDIASAAYVGTDGLFDSATLDKYVMSLENLSKAQADTALTAAGLDAAQKEQVFSALEAASSSATLTTQQILEAVATQTGSAADAEALLKKAGLITGNELEANSLKTVTAEQIKKAIANGQLSASDGLVITSALGITGANTGETASFGLLTKAIWSNIKAMTAWLTTNPVGWLVLAAGATVALVGVVDLFTTTIEENNQKIEEATTKIDEYQKAIDEINDKEKDATETYKEYASLMSKSNAYGLNAQEKEKLLSLSDKLVDTYGLEVEGIDSVTGAYVIGADAINNYVDALRAERIEKEKAQSKDRDKRIDANVDNLEKYQKDYDALKNAKEHYAEFQDIIDKYNKGISQEGLTQGQKQGVIVGFNTDLINKAASLGLKNSTDVASKIFKDVTGVEDIDVEAAKFKNKMSGAINSVIKDVLADIRVDNYDILDENGESLLDQMLTPYLTNVNWDSFNKDEFEGKVKEFIAGYGQDLSEISKKTKEFQEAASSGGLDFSGYEGFYGQLQKQSGLLKKMLDQNIIDENSYKEQTAQIASQIQRNIGLAMADISSKFGEGEESARGSFTAVANHLIDLENQFKDGSVTSTQYLDKLTETINNMDFTKTFGENTEAAQEFFATLTTKSSDVMADTLTQFEAGKISVAEYGDRLADFAEQQKVLAERTISGAKALGLNDEQINTLKDSLDEQNKTIDESIQKWEEFKNINSYLDENAGALNSFTSTASDGYTSYVSGLYSEFTKLSDDAKNSIISDMQQMEGMAGVTAENIQEGMLGNLSVTNALAAATCEQTNSVFSNLVSSGANLLSKFGEFIKGFDYTISTPIEFGDPIEILGVKTPLRPVKIHIKGEGGDSAQQLANAIGQTASAFQSWGNFIDVSDYGASFKKKSSNGGTSSGGVRSSGGSSNSGSGKSNSGKSKEDEAKKAEEERIKKELEQLKSGLEMRKELLEKYKDSVDLTDFGLDLAEENDFSLRTDLLNNKMSQLTAYGKAMREEFDRVASIIPKTGEQADALASHLESLGNDMRSNITALRETQVAMEQLKIDSIKNVSEYYLKDLEDELSSIERRMELLNKDNGKDYEYTNQILQMEMFLPTRSSSVDLQSGRSKADKEVIASEQATQNVLNDMFETQIQKNESLREDERKALLSAMETMRQDMVLNLDAASSTYDSYGEELSAITDAFTSYISSAINSMSLTVPKPDTSNFQRAANEIKTALSEINRLLGETPGSSQGDGGKSLGEKISEKLGGMSAGSKGVGAVAAARSFLGTPYVLGGTSRAGVDCSGLTYLAYKQMGVDIGRTTYSQYANTTRISKGQLRPGDLVFSRFGADGKEGPGHVGMYIGNGKTIESPGTGDVVKYSSIDKWEQYGRPFYATGTIKGNAQAPRLGIAGENFKPEILVDKATGETKYIDKPTVIDITKTDVVGEKQTAQIPKFASGTVDPMDIAAYIKQKYPEITNAGIAAILGNIQQESSFNPKSKTIEAYGSGSNRKIARWGLFQLDDTRIANWSNIVNNGTWQQQIDTALAEGRYANSGKGNNSNYNVWNKVLTNSSLGAAEAAKLWDRLYERSDGNSRNTRAENAEKYFQQISANTDALNANTQAVSESNPNQELIDKIHGLSDEYTDKINLTTLAGRAKAAQISQDDSLTSDEKAKALYDIYKPMAKETARIGAELYSDAFKQYNAWIEDVNADPSKYNKEIDDAWRDTLDNISSYVYEKENDLYEQREAAVEAIQKSFENKIRMFDKRSSSLDRQLQYAEARGFMTSTRYYEKMQDADIKSVNQTNAEIESLTNFLREQVKSGDIEPGSEPWHEINDKIDDLIQDRDEREIAIAERDTQIRQVLWDRFDYLIDSLSRITDESEFFINLLGDKLHDDNGKLNDKGMAVMGLHGANYNTQMEKALSYRNELAKIEDEIQKSPYDTNLIERKQELLSLQREAILAAKDEKDAIISLVEEGINLELNSLKELIDKYTESLNSAKDLYEYQKKISEQTQSISAIEKQLSAYENDYSEESRAKIQQLKVDLKDAKENLKDTEYDKYISDQEDLLNDLYEKFEETLNARLDDRDGLIESVIGEINSNSSSILDTLEDSASKVGVSVSDTMEDIWTKGDTALRSYLNEDNLIGGFELQANGYFNQMSNFSTGVTTSLGSISSDINSILKYASDRAKSEEGFDDIKQRMIDNSKAWWSAEEGSDEQKRLEAENKIYGDSLGYKSGEDGKWRDKDGDVAYTISNEDKIKGLVEQMKKNSAAWSEGNTAEDNLNLNIKNHSLAAQIAKLMNKEVWYDDDSGRWYVGRSPKKELYKMYARGGLADYTGPAWLDGTPAKPEMVLNPTDTENFIELKDYLAAASQRGLFNHDSAYESSFNSIPIPKNMFSRATTSPNIGNVTFDIDIDHVEDYNDFVNQMKKDKQLEKMIQSMTVDRIAGKSALAKNRYRW